MSSPLWPDNFPIEVLGVTGDFESGKTLFGLSIRPERTICFDLEGSATPYRKLGFTHRNMSKILMDKYGRDYTSKEVFETWWEKIQEIKPGEFDVIMVDPITDLDDAFTEMVRKRYKEFGFSSEENFMKMKGAFWNKVNFEWDKKIKYISSLCQTFVFTTHLKKEWVGNRPTDKDVPQGKKALFKLSSLYLFLERKTLPRSKELAKVPSAIRMKSRMGDPYMKDGVLHMDPFLPDRLPVATPEAIRDYIKNPPDFSNPKPGEKVKERKLSDDEKLSMQAQMAEDAKAAAELELEATKIKERVADSKTAAMLKMRPKIVVQGNGKDSQFSELTDQEADKLINKAKEMGMEDRVREGIHAKVSKRVSSVGDIILDPDGKTSAMNLTKAEYTLFIDHLNSLEKAKQPV